MNACDPDSNIDALHKFVKKNTGINLTMSRSKLCKAYSDIKNQRWVLPPMMMSPDRTWLIDKRSPLDAKEYQTILRQSTKVARIKRLANKVGAIYPEKASKQVMIDAIYARLKRMNILEPIQIAATRKRGAASAKTTANANSVLNVVSNGNNTNVNNSGNVKNANVNNGVNANANANNANVNKGNANANANANGANANANGGNGNANGNGKKKPGFFNTIFGQPSESPKNVPADPAANKKKKSLFNTIFGSKNNAKPRPNRAAPVNIPPPSNNSNIARLEKNVEIASKNVSNAITPDERANAKEKEITARAVVREKQVERRDLNKSLNKMTHLQEGEVKKLVKQYDEGVKSKNAVMKEASNKNMKIGLQKEALKENVRTNKILNAREKIALVKAINAPRENIVEVKKEIKTAISEGKKNQDIKRVNNAPPVPKNNKSAPAPKKANNKPVPALPKKVNKNNKPVPALPKKVNKNNKPVPPKKANNAKPAPPKKANNAKPVPKKANNAKPVPNVKPEPAPKPAPNVKPEPAPKPAPKKANNAKSVPKKANNAKPELPKKANNAKPVPKKANNAKPVPKKANNAKPAPPKKANNAKPVPKKANNAKPVPNVKPEPAPKPVLPKKANSPSPYAKVAAMVKSQEANNVALYTLRRAAKVSKNYIAQFAPGKAPSDINASALKAKANKDRVVADLLFRASGKSKLFGGPKVLFIPDDMYNKKLEAARAALNSKQAANKNKANAKAAAKQAKANAKAAAKKAKANAKAAAKETNNTNNTGPKLPKKANVLPKKANNVKPAPKKPELAPKPAPKKPEPKKPEPAPKPAPKKPEPKKPEPAPKPVPKKPEPKKPEPAPKPAPKKPDPKKPKPAPKPAPKKPEPKKPAPKPVPKKNAKSGDTKKPLALPPPKKTVSGLSVNKAKEQIRKLMQNKKISASSAFKRLSLKYHPNKGGSSANFIALQKARDAVQAESKNGKPPTKLRNDLMGRVKRNVPRNTNFGQGRMKWEQAIKGAKTNAALAALAKKMNNKLAHVRKVKSQKMTPREETRHLKNAMAINKKPLALPALPPPKKKNVKSNKKPLALPPPKKNAKSNKKPLALPPPKKNMSLVNKGVRSKLNSKYYNKLTKRERNGFYKRWMNKRNKTIWVEARKLQGERSKKATPIPKALPRPTPKKDVSVAVKAFANAGKKRALAGKLRVAAKRSVAQNVKRAKIGVKNRNKMLRNLKLKKTKARDVQKRLKTKREQLAKYKKKR